MAGQDLGKVHRQPKVWQIYAATLAVTGLLLVGIVVSAQPAGAALPAVSTPPLPRNAAYLQPPNAPDGGTPSPTTTSTNTTIPTDTPTSTPTSTETPPPLCGQFWRTVNSPDIGTQSALLGVAKVSGTDVWTVGYFNNGSTVVTLIEHWDGTQWSQVPSPNVGALRNTLIGVAARAANDVWAVGYFRTATSPFQTLTEHWDGTQWSIVPSPSPNPTRDALSGVAIASANDVWAVGTQMDQNSHDQTLILHWDGTQWGVVPSPNPGSMFSILRSVVALTTDDVWAVGSYNDGGPEDALAEHWDGTSWTLVPTPVPTPYVNSSFFSVAALSSSDIWAVGIAGDTVNLTLTEHWDGTQWSVVSSPSPGSSGNQLNGVAAVAGNDIWAVGLYTNGDMLRTLSLHWNGTVWGAVPSPNSDGDNVLQAVAVTSSTDVWAAGLHITTVFRALIERYNDPCVTPSPTATSTPSITDTPTRTATATVPLPTSTSTRTASVTPVATGTVTNTTTAIPTITSTPTRTATATVPLPTSTSTRTASATAVATAAGTSTATTIATVTQLTSTSTATTTPIPTGVSTSTATQTPTPCAMPFTDVYPTDYFYTPVLYLACHGVVSGYADHTFRPYNNTTRGQMAKIVVLGFGLSIDTSGGPHFTDTLPTNPFYQYVETAFNNGIVSGYSDQTFRPFANVTRGQLSKIIVVGATIARGWTVINPPSPTFSDVPRGSTFYTYIETAVSHGIITGYSDGTFRPSNDATRGQIAKIQYLAITNP